MKIYIHKKQRTQNAKNLILITLFFFIIIGANGQGDDFQKRYSKWDDGEYTGTIDIRKYHLIVKDGFLVQYRTWFLENGQICEDFNYKNGKRHGTWAWYYKSGIRKMYSEYSNDSLLFVENNRLYKKSEVVERTGTWYRDSIDVNRDISYIEKYNYNPELIVDWFGKHIYFDKSGNKTLTSQLFDRKKVGTWIYYNEDGAIQKTKTYDE